MKKLDKDSVLIALSVIILFFTAMINWNVYSWFILLAIILMIVAWYFKK